MKRRKPKPKPDAKPVENNAKPAENCAQPVEQDPKPAQQVAVQGEAESPPNPVEVQPEIESSESRPPAAARRLRLPLRPTGALIPATPSALRQKWPTSNPA